jgi:hypothetical protein
MQETSIEAGGTPREPLRGTVEPPPRFGRLTFIRTLDLHRVVNVQAGVAMILRDGSTVVLERGVACLAADLVRNPTALDVVDAAVIEGAR